MAFCPATDPWLPLALSQGVSLLSLMVALRADVVFSYVRPFCANSILLLVLVTRLLSILKPVTLLPSPLCTYLITTGVPLGFVCGYPLAGGEQYGGSMFIKSADSSLQGQAIQTINEKWGSSHTPNFCGRETIGIPVCKKKYAPFAFHVVDKDNQKVLMCERLFGCRSHSELRRKVIESHGERKGWEPFGQWSLKKAQELARKVTDRLNNNSNSAAASVSSSSSCSSSDNNSVDGSSSIASSSSPGDETRDDSSSSFIDTVPLNDLGFKSICNNGNCMWKMRHKHDNIEDELMMNNLVCQPTNSSSAVATT